MVRPHEPIISRIDAYNKAVNDYNQGVTTVTKVNEELNKKRSALLKSLNEARSQFLHKCTPKYN